MRNPSDGIIFGPASRRIRVPRVCGQHRARRSGTCTGRWPPAPGRAAPPAGGAPEGRPAEAARIGQGLANQRRCRLDQTASGAAQTPAEARDLHSATRLPVEPCSLILPSPIRRQSCSTGTAGCSCSKTPAMADKITASSIRRRISPQLNNDGSTTSTPSSSTISSSPLRAGGPNTTSPGIERSGSLEVHRRSDGVADRKDSSVPDSGASTTPSRKTR